MIMMCVHIGICATVIWQGCTGQVAWVCLQLLLNESSPITFHDCHSACCNAGGRFWSLPLERLQFMAPPCLLTPQALRCTSCAQSSLHACTHTADMWLSAQLSIHGTGSQAATSTAGCAIYSCYVIVNFLYLPLLPPPPPPCTVAPSECHGCSTNIGKLLGSASDIFSARVGALLVMHCRAALASFWIRL